MKIPESMIRDLICDPVMACEVMLGYKLDAFQKARLRYYWWVPTVVDSSGFSSGKTIVDWVYIQLRCMLIPDHRAGVIYQTFQIGKDTFWSYYRQCASPIFRSQLGKMDIEGDESGKSESQGAACYKQYFKNGSLVEMPAPNFFQNARTLASWRVNTLLLEEWTKAEATSDGIKEQLLGRVTRPNYNQHHPIWGNHITRTATAELGDHPSYATFQQMEKRVRRGNPDTAVISWSYKHFSNLLAHTGKTFREEYRMGKIIQELKDSLTPEKFKAEGLGIWARSSKGWYSSEMMEGAMELGRSRNLFPVISRAQDEMVRMESRS